MTTRRMLAAMWCVLLCVAAGTADTDGAVVLTGNALDYSRVEVEEADGQAAVQQKSEPAEITLDIHGAYKKVVLALLEAADEGTVVTGIAALDSLAATYGLTGLYRKGKGSGFYRYRFRLTFPSGADEAAIARAYWNLSYIHSVEPKLPPAASSGRLGPSAASSGKLEPSGRSGRVALKLLGGTVAGTGTATAIFLVALYNYWCGEDWCSEDQYEDNWADRLETGFVVSLIPMGIAVGVSAFDQHDRPIYPLAASLLGFGVGFALDVASAEMGGPVLGATLWLPVIAATVASEWSRERPESRRYSIGLKPEPGGGLSAVAALRFQ